MTNTTTDSRAVLRSEIAVSWDGADPWGSALSALGGVCDVLSYFGDDDLIPAEAGYRPAAGGANVEDYPASVFVELMDDGHVDEDGLAYWARVLNRYADLVPEDRRY